MMMATRKGERGEWKEEDENEVDDSREEERKRIVKKSKGIKAH